MIRPIKVDDLKVGMYIKLGRNAHLLPLFEEEFTVSSEKQIANIIDKGIALVDVDTEKSNVEVPMPEDYNPLALISDQLRETLEDEKAPPEERARAVYDNSIKMMRNLIEEPSADNILHGKNLVGDIVDHVLADDETADHLTQITEHDYYTYTHSVNVGIYGVLLAKAAFGRSVDHDMRELGTGFFLHDLGKCNVPSDIINKPGRLTNEEWEHMRKHPTYGERILKDTGHLTKECNLIVLQHHEREDGSGYPQGLSKQQIHLYARLCSIADVYEALTSTRAYKKKLATFEALRVMKDEMLNHFTKELFDKFVMLFR